MKSAAAAVALLLVTPGHGFADDHPDALVLRGWGHGDPLDVRSEVSYAFEGRRALIQREGLAPDGAQPVPQNPDLRYRGTRHIVVPRITAGLYWNVALSLALPIVLSDSRSLRADGTSSSTVTDGLVPAGGFDAQGGTGSLFRGPSRSGLDQLHLELDWAVSDQSRRPSLPTWKLYAGVRLSVGQVMRLSRQAPTGETGISRGVHEAEVGTSFGHKRRWATILAKLWWRFPIGTRSGAPIEALPQAFGARHLSAPSRLGLRTGLQADLWQPSPRFSIAASLAGELEAISKGREYTEMWEVFGFAGDAANGGPLVLDADPTMPGLQPLSHPGVSNTQGHVQLGARLAVVARAMKNLRFELSSSMSHAQSHLLTFAVPGIDLPGCAPEQTSQCEMLDDQAVTPGTREVNPLYIPLIDLPGRRYRVASQLTYQFGISAQYLY